MESWPVQHRISALELFIKTESLTAIQCDFQQQFQEVMLLTAILCHYGYQNGVKKDQ